jgi:hypothetical protein
MLTLITTVTAVARARNAVAAHEGTVLNPDLKIRRRKSRGHDLPAMGETHLPDVCGEHHTSEVGGKGRRSLLGRVGIGLSASVSSPEFRIGVNRFIRGQDLHPGTGIERHWSLPRVRSSSRQATPRPRSPTAGDGSRQRATPTGSVSARRSRSTSAQASGRRWRRVGSTSDETVLSLSRPMVIGDSAAEVTLGRGPPRCSTFSLL